MRSPQSQCRISLRPQLGAPPSTRRAAGWHGTAVARWFGMLSRGAAVAAADSIRRSSDRSIGVWSGSRGRNRRLGHWTAQTYPTAMTALAGTALLCSGSTTTQGPYAPNIRRAVDYLMTKVA